MERQEQVRTAPLSWTLTDLPLTQIEARVIVIGIAQPFSQRGILGYINHTLNFILDRREDKITGIKGERVLISTQGQWKSPWVLFYGLGPGKELSPDIIAQELKGLREDLNNLGLGKAAYLLPGYDPYKWGSPAQAARLLAEIMPPGIVAHANRDVLQSIQEVFKEYIPVQPPPVATEPVKKAAPEPRPTKPIKEEEKRPAPPPPPPPTPRIPPSPPPAPEKTQDLQERTTFSFTKPWGRTMDSYLLKEILSPFILGIGIFMLLLFLGRISDLLAFLRGGSLTLIFSLIVSMVVASLSMVLPPAFLFGSIVAISRFSADSELIAMHSLGISLKRISLPILLMAFWVTVAATFLSLYVSPLANQALYGSVLRMAYSSQHLGLREGKYVRLSKYLWIYSSHLHNSHLGNPLLYDNREGSTKVLSATKGKIKVDPDTHAFALILKEGEILTVKGRKYNLLTFHQYRFLLPGLGPSFKGFSRRELSFPQLLKKIQRDKQKGRQKYWEVLNHLHKRFSLPFSAVVFALLALALGPFLPRAEKWTGLLLTFGLFLLYYIFLTLSQNMAMKGFIPPFLGAWFPDIILGTGGAAFLWLKSEKAGL
jgi:LPS export ABC transporter permease LptF